MENQNRDEPESNLQIGGGSAIMSQRGDEIVGEFNQVEYAKAYNKEQYDTVNLRIPKGLRKVWKESAQKANQSLNAYVMQAVKERMESEN